MSDTKLPERASLEYLKKLAKDRLPELRQADPNAKLAAALLAVARDYGYSSWRALKADVEQREQNAVARFFEACAEGRVEVLRDLLAKDPDLVRIANPHGPYGGWTGLHSAAQGGHQEAVRLLLEHGADPNAREVGDNTHPLHWAAARRDIEIVRALLDAGGDVHGTGDVHQLDTIGWATFYHSPDGAPGERPEMAALLVERGAQHHIFSAISLGDLSLIRRLVEENPEALDRRMSRFEQGQTPLHFAMSLHRYQILDLLIELGADLEAEDANGHTALAVAMMQGDREAMRRLHAAGAKASKGWSVGDDQPGPRDASDFQAEMAQMGEPIRKIVPMITVPDIAQTLEWYTSIGFRELGRYGDGKVLNWGMLAFGKAELMLRPGKKSDAHTVDLWFYTDRVDGLYQLLKSRQIDAAQTTLAGGADERPWVEFVEDIYDPPYGGRQFSIRDLNGYTLIFYAQG